jgi:cycloartenol synthase
MWKLKIGAETVRGDNGDDNGGNESWVKTLNNHLGRQVWEFHPEMGTPEELQQIHDARNGFADRRFDNRHSSDILMRIQVHPLSLFIYLFIIIIIIFLF